MDYKRVNEFKDFFRLFKNWYARIFEFFELYPNSLVQYRMRNGLVYFVRQKTSDVSSIIEPLGSKGYLKFFNISPKDTVIDIGANIGGFSIYAADAATKGIVYAFEPVENNFIMLQKNIQANNIKNIKTFRKGVLGKEKKTRIFLAKRNSNHSIFKKEKNSGSILASFTSLPKIFSENRIGRCDFLKIDCEGAEYDILMTCPEDTLKKIAKIAVEVHEPKGVKNRFKLKSFLEKNGFKTILEEEKERLGKTGRGIIYAQRS